MMRQISTINWRYIGDAVPAFVTVMFIPFGYSAAYGLIAGLLVYTALNGMIYLTKIISGGYLIPDDEDHREYWSSKFSTFIVCLNPRALILLGSQTLRKSTLVPLCQSGTSRSRSSHRKK
jgi:xanthine/uracil/vitamin C permease (AzgA family)